ncbi:MAG TPA: sigma-70 family RNA polymerase sigma factor [Verrucomicrobiae bacterium]|jgi:RNA polymerase sigma-70 factor (ECF subfamily)|nr:sigma-70 family RNA polymerase sigma factor [Verrucomicrobiae bacterium]
MKNETTVQVVEMAQAELLRRIARQDINALGEFYDQTARPLFSIAYRMLQSREEAEEVIQDVFVRIWTKSEEFDSAKGQPFCWALSITRNRCIDRLRARQRRSEIIADFNGDHEWVSPMDFDAGQASLLENEGVAIRSAVNNLPHEQRQAIELAFFRGMTHPEIADSLMKPLGTIKARIRRGMLTLRKALKDHL